MTSLVVDASIIGGILLTDEWTERVPTVLGRIGGTSVFAPAHWPAETANLLAMAMRRRRIDREDRDRLMSAVFKLSIALDEVPFANRATAILAIADPFGLTVYDAAYLELAERLNADLATNDADLAKAAAARNVAIVSSIS